MFINVIYLVWIGTNFEVIDIMNHGEAVRDCISKLVNDCISRTRLKKHSRANLNTPSHLLSLFLNLSYLYF